MKRRRFPWTPADDQILRDHFAHEPTTVTAQRLGRSVASTGQRANSLGIHKSPEYFAAGGGSRIRPGQSIGPATQFRKGQVPANKGVKRGKGWAPGRMAAGQFKPGHGRSGKAAEVWKPIGHERISKDGYLERKVNSGMPLQRRWRAVHLILWEEANGPLPKGFAVCFVNGDKRDIRLENLTLVSRRDLMARNSVQRFPTPLRKAIQLVGALNRQIRRRSSHGQEQDR